MNVQAWTFLLVAASFALYIGIAVWSRASSTKDFYVAFFERDGKDAIISLVFTQLAGQSLHLLLFVEEDAQLTARFQFHAFDQLGLGAEPVHDTREVASVAAGLTELFLEAVDLLDYRHRDDKIVVFEAEQRLRVVQQDVGV